MDFQERFSEVIQSYGAGALDDSRILLKSLRPQEAANLLEASPPKVREFLWDLMDDDTSHQVLHHLGEDVRADFLEAMDTAQLAAADDLDTDDLADLLQELPDTIAQQVLDFMSAADRARVEAVMSFPEDSAGGLMNTDAITVQPRHALEIVLRYLRLRKDLPEITDALVVVNSRDEYVGMLPIAKLLTSDPSVTVREVMDTDARANPVDTNDTEVARLFSEEDLVSAPVVDATGKLVGRITIDDVVDVIIEDPTTRCSPAPASNSMRIPSPPSPSPSGGAPSGSASISLPLSLPRPSSTSSRTPSPRWWRSPCSCPSSPAWAASPAPRR